MSDSVSKVYFTTMKTTLQENLQQKLIRLIKKAGMGSIDFDKKYTAIKIHFGEMGNLAYLRPNYARTIADFIKAQGGKPFLTDCNTLYVGGRKNALDHIETAYINGFTPYSTGCHILIADGLKGTDEQMVPVRGGKHVKEAKIGQAVMDADIFISLNHFKGHEATGFGGAIKNIGMGCGSRAGKMEMHSSGKPVVFSGKCIGCGACLKICAHDAITITDKVALIDHEKCVGCGRCIGVCPVDAVQPGWDEANDVLNEKMAEYTWAVLHDRPHFHISFVIDVSPNCDCHAENDIPIVPDIGIFASFDPIALDVACADAVNRELPVKGSILAENSAVDVREDHFATVSPATNWRSAVDHAVNIGVGNREYELITL